MLNSTFGVIVAIVLFVGFLIWLKFFSNKIILCSSIVIGILTALLAATKLDWGLKGTFAMLIFWIALSYFAISIIYRSMKNGAGTESFFEMRERMAAEKREKIEAKKEEKRAKEKAEAEAKAAAEAADSEDE